MFLWRHVAARSASLRSKKITRTRLEDVSLGLDLPNELLQHFPLVQPERPREVGHARVQQCGRDVVGDAAGELAHERPPVHAAARHVARPSHHVESAALHQRHVLWDELRLR